MMETIWTASRRNNSDRRDDRNTTKNSWFWWGVDKFHFRRKPLLICAFIFNLTAISCISAAAVAIGTSSSLMSIGWASGTTTIVDIPQCNNPGASIKVSTWLGLKGYYSKCVGEINGTHDDRISSNLHSGNFCSGSSTPLASLERDESFPCSGQEELDCEVITFGRSELSQHCNICEETSRDCVGTLVPAVAFGVFPLVLTIRRFYAVKSEKGLRLRTLFFTFLAIFFGLHAFIRFHVKCVTKVRSSFAAIVCSEACNDGKPFILEVPIDFTLSTGGRLVIIAAFLKISYFMIHLVTPVVREQSSPYDSSFSGEKSKLLPQNAGILSHEDSL
mmetsp:Transcript_27955/g.39309  ORF Transcript_27955/g.39309 Transcript_27955/m.39309 type:complete len:332 (-) Transcript_27955:159-1154(-)